MMTFSYNVAAQKRSTSTKNCYFDETVQASLAKLAQEITSREWKLDAASEKPGDIAIKEFCRRHSQRDVNGRHLSWFP